MPETATALRIAPLPLGAKPPWDLKFDPWKVKKSKMNVKTGTTSFHQVIHWLKRPRNLMPNTLRVKKKSINAMAQATPVPLSLVPLPSADTRLIPAHRST
ncbi:hypothetical protein SAV31267_099770 [Streptomyces avermitilis]|uniref:Uncharacterized protein n=1 Tax=Streptomyces avermitilis TaxID=33903 RepID=A0A4D4N7D1_STRAX|nr:hypothetical protein SAV31267_099770 [Streptomyces avermitilis]